MSISRYTGQCVVVFGTASLQQYIFQSNRLKENIGASYLAAYWFGDGLTKATQADRTAWNKYVDAPWKDPLENPVATDKDINVIYVGGGNAALLCKDLKSANKAVKAWSCELLKKAPGLRVVVGYGEVKGSLAKAYRAALKDLNRCEEAPPFGASLGGLPVVRTCTSTGLPASQPSEEPYEENQWISAAADRKRKESQNAITNKLESILEAGQHFAIKPEEELGGSEGQSHIAVVHADGNGMGKLLNDVIDEADQDDADFLHNLRAFSASVSFESLRALVETLKCLQAALPRLGDDLAVDTSKIFPLRPIVYGGDDLTFVCDGRLGLNLAALYLEEFAKGKIRVLGECKPVSACAGVAIVPTKFPFARVYGFADELCGLAKDHRRNQGKKGNWIDFQIIQEGATRSVTALRNAQYSSMEGEKLHRRPYQVQGTWDGFVAILKGFQSQQWPRSRAKGLLRALTQGSAATQRLVDGAQWQLPSSDVSNMGWTGGEAHERTTPYFDPLEALDFYIEAKPVTSPTADNGETEKGNEE
jgi:hypothetical protein